MCNTYTCSGTSTLKQNHESIECLESGCSNETCCDEPQGDDPQQ